MSNIQVLRNLGTDAFANLYDIFIPAVPGITGVDGLEFRVRNFSIPESPRAGVYDIHYKSLKITKINSKITVENELSFPLRVDRYWAVYNYFLAWKKLGINQETGVVDEDLIPKVPIIVKSSDNSNNPTGGIWTFSNFYPIAIEGFDFDWESEDPVEVTIAGIYDLFAEEVVPV